LPWSGSPNDQGIFLANVELVPPTDVTRMRREWEAQRGSLATVRRFNATLSAKGYVWFWPKIAAALRHRG
jgi:hypothetical protein